MAGAVVWSSALLCIPADWTAGLMHRMAGVLAGDQAGFCPGSNVVPDHSMSLGTIASVSSSILNTPNRSSVQAGQEHGEDDPRRNGETMEKGRGLRMSDAELKRFNWLLGQGHSLAAARELCRFSVVSQKRQRSEDQPSPNTGGQSGPQNKRSKDNHNPGPGITFKELADAVPIAITTEGYPATRLSMEQLVVVKEALITMIGNLVNPVVRPNFRSCEFKQGYLKLACGDACTASWLKETITSLIPWEGASLKAIEVADLPKLHSFTAYVFDSCNDSTGRILQLMENQNIGLSTKSWRVIKRKVIAKTVELLLEVDEKSAETIAANNSHLNYKFSKVERYSKKATRGASNDHLRKQTRLSPTPKPKSRNQSPLAPMLQRVRSQKPHAVQSPNRLEPATLRNPSRAKEANP
ncbi:hypothetical protein pipiens_008281 [Culex pipiens pipiens]|uniref:DUF4780 domain-containing protein n=1 Tax=Culex pipiens pipiens TaxID=38569 RepID=A0ABD1DI58_CULPP